ncbi:MAG: DNA-protecting protein DprA, partial [Lachnospiraceae bacterium]|nr:DNA-protecting protein DprA [Lachnospiraceae bacterium]
DIYAVPGSIWNERSYGCNKWLKEGAQVLYDMDVFIEELKESWEYHRNLTAGCDTDDGFGLFDMRKVKSTVESGIISGIKPIEDIRKKAAAEASEICERKKIDINVFRSERIRNLTPIQQDVYLALNARFQGVDNIMTRVPEPVLLPVLIATLNELEHMGLASSDCGRFRRM